MYDIVAEDALGLASEPGDVRWWEDHLGPVQARQDEGLAMLSILRIH